jgi:hypothetical protein
MKIKIYLNDGEDHFFGFKNDFANSPELTMVHEFEITETEMAFVNCAWYNNSAPVQIMRILEWIFEELNIGEKTDLAKQYRAKQLRSLSVGDVVAIGEMAFACESAGWEKITTEELNKAIIWDDTIGGLP